MLNRYYLSTLAIFLLKITPTPLSIWWDSILVLYLISRTADAPFVSVRVLMSLAGHRSIGTTQAYIDVNDDMKRKAVELV